MKPTPLYGILANDSDEVNLQEHEASFDCVPVLPLRGIVALPTISIPIPIGRESSMKLVEDAVKSEKPIFLVAQKNEEIENPKASDLYRVGVLATVHRLLELPDGSRTAFVTAGSRAHLVRVTSRSPYLKATVTVSNDPGVGVDHKMSCLIELIFSEYREFLNLIGEKETQEIRYALGGIKNPFRAINFICTNLPVDVHSRQEMLECPNIETRCEMLMSNIMHVKEEAKICNEIISNTREEITQQQREQFLQQQIRTIQEELGTADNNDVEKLSQKALSKNWPSEMNSVFNRELRKLERFNPSTPDYGIQFNYIETMLNLPWNEIATEDFSLETVEEVLDRDHFGLDKVKERIVEQMAVLKLRSDMKAPILCLFGPPGVGKTSLGKSVADALGREYCRISLGGLHDEAEIRGHRKTYIGAMPGRIIAALSKCKTNNPVFVLDEIDKIGKDFKGDPSTALLEVLDPEQNDKFHDNYLDIDYDLSKVLFLATANDLSTISRPLRDRMEIIDIAGYVVEEKVEIAMRHLIKKSMSDHGLADYELTFEREAIKNIIEGYTRESGVRQLEKKISKVMRKLARLIASGKETPQIITPALVKEYLGEPDITPDMYEGNDTPGVVTGLAWTQTGGEILFIESSLSKGKGEKLSLTGNLGDVMKESAMLAMQYLKANAEELGINPEDFTKYDVHVHVPEGAVPKDGPSAGITMTTSLASSFTGRKVRPRLAMTGEITLRGKVLPVGGIQEKILAAKRAGITDIILCERNRKDINEIKKEYVEGMNFHYVNTIKEVLDFALVSSQEQN